jgi:hypothetical protein
LIAKESFRLTGIRMSAKYLCFKADSSLKSHRHEYHIQSSWFAPATKFNIGITAFGFTFKAFFPDALVLSLHGYIAYFLS